MQAYGADQVLLDFPAAISANGRWYTNFVNAGPNWTFTLHGIPAFSDIKVEANNSRLFQVGAEGNINPISYAIRSGNQSVKATGTAMDGSFSANWVILKPSSEFVLSSNSGCVSCETGVWPVQGMFRYLRLSMTATPSATTRAYYFDSNMILK